MKYYQFLNQNLQKKFIIIHLQIETNQLSYWKKIIKNKEIKYEKQDVFKAMNLNKKWLKLGINNNNKKTN